MVAMWYFKRSTGEIKSTNLQLHPPRNRDDSVIRNSCGNLEYPSSSRRSYTLALTRLFILIQTCWRTEHVAAASSCDLERTSVRLRVDA